MSRISDLFLNCVLYLFPTEQAARKGNAQGGTGFLYSVPTENDPKTSRVFVVTCKHLLKTEKIFLRVNKINGGYKILDTLNKEWFTDSSEDLAIYPLAFDEEIKPSFVRRGFDTLNQGKMTRMNIGPGDDVFIVGRFVHHGGIQQNTPVVRFGNLAMMPIEPIFNPEINLEVPCYLVDLRIREGFSGSPVFVKYENRISREGSQYSGPWNGESLLGLSWGAIKTKEQVKFADNDLPIPDYGVDIHEGMACITPVERIDSLIDKFIETEKLANHE